MFLLSISVFEDLNNMFYHVSIFWDLPLASRKFTHWHLSGWPRMMWSLKASTWKIPDTQRMTSSMPKCQWKNFQVASHFTWQLRLAMQSVIGSCACRLSLVVTGCHSDLFWHGNPNNLFTYKCFWMATYSCFTHCIQIVGKSWHFVFEHQKPCTTAQRPGNQPLPWKARVWPYWTNNIAPMLTGEQMRLGWVVSRAGTVIPRGKSIVFPMNIGISVNLGVDPPVLDRTLTFLGSPFRYLPKSSHVNPRIDKPCLLNCLPGLPFQYQCITISGEPPH